MKDEGNNGYRHILKYTGVFGSVQGLNVLAALVRNKFAAILLGPAGLGVSSILNSWQGLICQCGNLGISFSAVPCLSELYEQGDETHLRHQILVIRSWSMLSALLGFVLCIVFSPLMGSWVHLPTVYFLILAPAVALLAISGGETAILKATRKLKALAVVQVVASIVSVLASVPLYYILGVDGIAPLVIVMAVVTLSTTILYSYRHFPPRISFSKDVLKGGKTMIQLGIAFILAAVAGQVAEVFIRIFLTHYGQLEEVGLYNAAYTLTVSYAALALAAVESDYFPRLSAVSHDSDAANVVINRQTEVLLLLLPPLLVAMVVFLPVLVPLLYSGRFASIIPMAQVMALAMLFKVLSLPLCYLPLAHRDSRSYLILEVSYWVYFLILFVVGYQLWGLWGTGIAIVVAHVIEWLVAWTWARHHYQYRMSASVGRYTIIQLIPMLIVYLMTLLGESWMYWVVGILMMLVSGAFSFQSLRRLR